MAKREIFLLDVIGFLESNHRTDIRSLMALLFIFSEENKPIGQFYSFHPTIDGPYSMKIWSDLAYLSKMGLVIEQKEGNSVKYQISDSGKQKGKAEFEFKSIFQKLVEKYPTNDALRDYIDVTYPKFTIKQVLKRYKEINANKSKFFLIGYEGRDIDTFLNILIQNQIQNLVDVRNNPNSMKFDFNKNRLQKSLEKVQIKYHGMPELGISKELRKDVKNQTDYETLFRYYAKILPTLSRYIDQIIEMGRNERIGIMCFEKDAEKCHRREIGKFLASKGLLVEKI